MLYVGGGSGMAPLRRHLSHLFETLDTRRKVSFWFGARSRQEIFYQDYFEGLAARHANFRFHVALSEPQPEDAWMSHVGLIHDVVKREHLDSHPHATRIEYYLCGPPAMVSAVRSMLKDAGVDPNRSRSMSISGGTKGPGGSQTCLSPFYLAPLYSCINAAVTLSVAKNPREKRREKGIRPIIDAEDGE